MILEVMDLKTGQAREVAITVGKTAEDIDIAVHGDHGPSRIVVQGYPVEIEGWNAFAFVLHSGQFKNETMPQWTVTEAETGMRVARHPDYHTACALALAKLFNVGIDGLKRAIEAGHARQQAMGMQKGAA